MKNINWTVRIKNKTFWLALIPAVLLLVQAVCGLFGYDLQIEALNNQLIDIVNSLFTVLVIMGIIVDPTTEGIDDSDVALTYLTPKKKTK